MAHILMVDDASSLAELFGAAIGQHLGHEVTVVIAVADVPDLLDEVDAGAPPPDLALVDLSFPQERVTGLEALAIIHRRSPSTKLAIVTQGDEWVAEVLRDAWELLPIVTVISKTAPLDYQLGAIERVLTEGEAPVDPAIQPLLPAVRPAWRTPERFALLIQHQGHAKVWSALMDPELDATYREVSERTGLKLNTIKNYRTQLLSELGLHGLEDPSLREMQDFALRCRPFLEPYVQSALSGADR